MAVTVRRHEIGYSVGFPRRTLGRSACRRRASLHTIRIVSSKPERRIRRTWPDETGPVELEFLYRREESGWVLVELRLSTYPEFAPHPVDTALLRRLRLGRVTRHDVRKFTDAEELQDDPRSQLPENVVRLIDDRLADLTDSQGERPGPRSLSFRHFAKLAAIYEAAARSWLTPTEQVADWAEISRAAAEKQILRARKLGFLPPPQVGRQMAWVDEESEKRTRDKTWFEWAQEHADEERDLWDLPTDE